MADSIVPPALAPDLASATREPGQPRELAKPPPDEGRLERVGIRLARRQHLRRRPRQQLVHHLPVPVLRRLQRVRCERLVSCPCW